MNLQWEMIVPVQNFNYTERLRVPGGWLVCRIDGAKNPASMAMNFIFDPDHTWEIPKSNGQNEAG